MKQRLGVAAAILGVWVLALEGRLVMLQVVDHDGLVARAERQQMSRLQAPAKRGEIFDRRGRLLAYSVDADTIYAVPSEVGDPAATAAKVCAALKDCDKSERAGIARRLARGGAFAYVKRRVTPGEARAVAALGLDGIGFTTESKRFYPNRELASHLIGYAGTDNEGLGGIEAAYEKVVRGRDGKLLVQTDARGKAFSRLERQPTASCAPGSRSIARTPARPSYSIRTTVRSWQWPTGRPSTRTSTATRRRTRGAIAQSRTSTSQGPPSSW
jgi:cell division protein FtsI (penicillin-binding protein 3)